MRINGAETNTSFYEVTVKSTKKILIEAKTEEEAKTHALNAFVPRFDNSFVVGSVDIVSVDYVETKQQLEQSKKSCDELLLS